MSKQSQPPHDESEELAHYDDAIIGRAFRWSALALILLLASGATIFLLLKRKGAATPPKITEIAAPVTQQFAAAQVPEAKFTDITESAGITFLHNNGAVGDKLLPETMGGGVAFFDFDGDGDQDLLFINSTDWPEHRSAVVAGPKAATMALYHNDGKGHFTDVTAGSGLDVSFYGMGVAIGDYDNDGLDDVYITAVGGNHLFHNLGHGKFKEVTETAEVGGSTNDWGTCAAWVDY